RKRRRCPLERSTGDCPAAGGTVSEQIKKSRSETYPCRSSFFNTRCCTCPCYVGRDRLESSHWRGRSGSERNHHDDYGQNRREVANHGFSGHRERGIDKVKEQNL